MSFQISRQQFGLHLLRLGLAGVFLWFGFSQLLDSLRWVSVVPQWAVDLLRIPPAMIVLHSHVLFVLAEGDYPLRDVLCRIEQSL